MVSLSKSFFAQIFILQDVNVQIPRTVSHWAELARQRHSGFVFPFKPWKWTTFSSKQCCRVSSDIWALKSVGITDILLVMTSLSSRWSWNDIHEAAMFVVEQASSQGGREINCTCASWVQHHVGLLNNGEVRILSLRAWFWRAQSLLGVICDGANLDLFCKAKIIQLFKLFSSKHSAWRTENGWIRICGSRTRNVSCCLRKSTEGRVTRLNVCL